MSSHENSEPHNVENTFPQPGDHLRAGEVSPDAIEWVMKELRGAAQLCTALSMMGHDSAIEPDAVDAIGDLIRQAAKKLGEELTAAEARK